MNKIVITFFLLITCNLFSQDIIGHWKTLDTNKNINSIVEIYKENGFYYGKIIRIPRKDYKGYCDTCKGKYKNKDLINVVILTDFKKENDTYENGKITDPENGKTYSCYLKLVSKNKLKIRGYIGFSMLGRTEYWYRVTKQDFIKYKQN